MPVADFKIAFGFVLCQGFVTPPASEVPAILTPAFPAASVRLPQSPPGTDSWERAASHCRRDGARTAVIRIFWCQLAGVFQL